MCVHGCRWLLQGMFRNELSGIQYPGPESCISVGLPGASEEDIKQVTPLWPLACLLLAEHSNE